eukprot:3014524-Prymnesium_polylepis.1
MPVEGGAPSARPGGAPPTEAARRAAVGRVPHPHRQCAHGARRAPARQGVAAGGARVGAAAGRPSGPLTLTLTLTLTRPS